MNWVATAVPVPIYGIPIKIGLTETLTFVSGFVFGPIQGFITGFLTIVVSDLFILPGLWTPFIAAIIGTLGLLEGVLRRFKHNPNVPFLGMAAVVLTMISEVLQNIWLSWYMWTFYMPSTPFMIVFWIVQGGGIYSMVAALINNVVLFVAVAPKTINLLQEWVIPKAMEKSDQK